MEKRIIEIPKDAQPIIDRTEFDDGRLFLLLCMEHMPLWVAGAIFDHLPWGVKLIPGWTAFQYDPRLRIHRPKGLFFFSRDEAVKRAEEMIMYAARLLFRC